MDHSTAGSPTALFPSPALLAALNLSCGVPLMVLVFRGIHIWLGASPVQYSYMLSPSDVLQRPAPRLGKVLLSFFTIEKSWLARPYSTANLFNNQAERSDTAL